MSNSRAQFEERFEDCVCLPPDAEQLELFTVGGKTCDFCQSWRDDYEQWLKLEPIIKSSNTSNAIA